MGDRLAQSDQGLASRSGMLEDVILGTPLSRLSEKHDSRAAELEHGFFRAPAERFIEIVNLGDPSNRKRPYFDHGKPAELVRFQQLHAPFGTKQDVGLALQCIRVNRPKPRT